MKPVVYWEVLIKKSILNSFKLSFMDTKWICGCSNSILDICCGFS